MPVRAIRKLRFSVQQALKNTSLPVILLALLLIAFTSGKAGGLDSKDKPDGKNRDRETQEVVVKGRVRLVGTDLFSGLVVTDEKNQDWYIAEQDHFLLSGYQQRIITVKGRPDYRDIILADGKKAGVRSYLLDIDIVDNQ
jgi:hypothetical protein